MTEFITSLTNTPLASVLLSIFNFLLNIFSPSNAPGAQG